MLAKLESAVVAQGRKMYSDVYGPNAPTPVCHSTFSVTYYTKEEVKAQFVLQAQFMGTDWATDTLGPDDYCALYVYNVGTGTCALFAKDAGKLTYDAFVAWYDNANKGDVMVMWDEDANHMYCYPKQ